MIVNSLYEIMLNIFVLKFPILHVKVGGWCRVNFNAKHNIKITDIFIKLFGIHIITCTFKKQTNEKRYLETPACRLLRYFNSANDHKMVLFFKRILKLTLLLKNRRVRFCWTSEQLAWYPLKKAAVEHDGLNQLMWSKLKVVEIRGWSSRVPKEYLRWTASPYGKQTLKQLKFRNEK